ncbi:MAG: caspase family protein [Crocinitomicaceae bacterium]
MRTISILSLFFTFSLLAQKQTDYYLVINPNGHKSLIYDMAIDAKGKIITGSFDKNTIVWNPETGQIDDIYYGNIGPGSEGMVYTVDVSPDNHYLAVAGWMGKEDESEDLGDIRIYNYQTGKLRKRLKYHDNVVMDLEFSPDGRWLISGDANGSICKWDMFNMNPVIYFLSPNEGFKNVSATQDGFYTSHDDGMVYKWDYDNAKPVKKINMFEKIDDLNVSSVVRTSPDGETVVVGGKEIGMILVLNNKLALKQYFFTGDNSIVNLAVAPSGNRLAASIDQKGNNSIRIYDFNGKKWDEVCSYKGDDLMIGLEFTDENNVICAGEKGNYINLLKIKNGEFVVEKRMGGVGTNYYSAAMNGNELAFSNLPTKAYGNSEYTKIFDLFTRKVKTRDINFHDFNYPERSHEGWSLRDYDYLRKDQYDPSAILLIENDKGNINDSIQVYPWSGNAFFSYSFVHGEYIVAACSYGVLQAYDKKGKLLTRFVGHEGGIRSVTVSSNGKFLVSSGIDMTVRFWPLENIGKMNGEEPNVIHPKASMFISQDNEWVLWNQEGYFTSSKKGARYVGYHVNYGKDSEAKFYPFDQFDLKYNRPDILMKDLEVADAGIIELYRMAFLKRLERMGLKEEDLAGDIHTPEIKSMYTRRKDDQLTVKVEAVDSKYPLTHMNVYVNDVPIHGRTGLPIEATQEHKSEFVLDLIDGINKIEISFRNEVGVESLRETQFIDNSAMEKGELYVVAVGVSNYKDDKYNLNYAAKDAKDVVELFAEQKAYSKVHTKLLTDIDVTKENIFAIKDFLKSARTKDVVMMFIAGHGVLDDKLDYYYCTHDMDFNNPAKKGVSYNELEVLFDGIRAIRKLLIMDTCHSGELFKDEVEEVAITEEEGTDDIVFRSNQGTTTVRERQGLQKTNEAVKEMFNDLNRGTGTTVISSAGGVEYAMESDEWKNGLFTFCLLEGIESNNADLNKDGKIFLAELQQYIQSKVYDLSRGKQQPTSRFENISLDYQIW